MIDIIHESGFGAFASLFFALAGLAAILTVGRKSGRPGSIAAAFAVAVLAAGALGVGTGQRKVDHAVREIPAGDVAQRVEILSLGTREASANLLLSGSCAITLMIIGGGLALVAARRRPPTA